MSLPRALCSGPERRKGGEKILITESERKKENEPEEEKFN